MNDLNYVLLAGNVVRDPESKVIDGTNTVCTFDIGVNRSFYNKKEEKWVNYACFFHVETWGHVAESCAKNLRAGRGVRLVGRLHQSSWQTKGRWGERVFIISEHVEFQPIKKTESVSVATPQDSEMEKMDLKETMDQLEGSIEHGEYEAGPETFEERKEDCFPEE